MSQVFTSLCALFNPPFNPTPLQVQYKKEQVEAAWPLGAAINSLG